MDEVGRGPLAGPVVAGAVILPIRPAGEWVELIDDSKRLTPAKREEAFPLICWRAVAFGTGAASSEEIDALGIVGGTRLAMTRALDFLAVRPDFLLLDAFPLVGVAIPQRAIIHGDALCLSIAAASIVAKVTRDRLMESEDARYSGYGFARNKGYATREHLDGLTALGPCEIHRRSFAPVRSLIEGPEQAEPAPQIPLPIA